jgi:hypothetical protein
VRVAGLLLALQAVVYLAFTLYLYLARDLRRCLRTPPQLEQPPLGYALILITLLTILSALSFLFLLRAGWLLAMVTQGVSLLSCLVLYFGFKPAVIFPVMLYCIVMAFFLNSANVRVVFHGAASDGR